MSRPSLCTLPYSSVFLPHRSLLGVGGRFFKLPSRFQFLRSSLASFLNSTKAVLNEALGKGPFFTEVDTGTILGNGKHGKTSLLSLVIY